MEVVMTTTTTVTLSAESKKYGEHKQYIARIVGRDSKFTFSREFIGGKNGSVSVADVDTPGLYEICDIDKRGDKEQVYRIVAETPDGLQEFRASKHHADTTAESPVDGKAQAMAIAKRIDAGEQFAEIVETVKVGDEWRYRQRTKAQAKKTAIAVTVNSAIEHCWQVLQTLPEREAKAVMKALKERISPKPVDQLADATQRDTAEQDVTPIPPMGDGEQTA
jgi:hypothetical protein